MFKKFFSAGLLFWMPLLFTVWILDSVIEFSDRLLVFLPPRWLPESIYGVHIPGFGLLVAAAIVLLTGVVVANVLGRKLVYWWETLLERIPVVKQLYGGIKKIAGTFLNPQSQSFQKVVLVEYPRKGMWTLGFVANQAGPALSQGCGGRAVAVFIPTAPNPTSGYVVLVPQEDVRDTSCSIDEALTFHVSMGVVQPGSASEAKRSES